LKKSYGLETFILFLSPLLLPDLVYGMILTAFLCFAGCLTEDWYTKGKHRMDKQY
ncbi:hypothetical protein scyTo_0021765, partial [Scyliorhinus torazame]|nr:hypothetical protein [Scyliorhinus torazame]